MAINLAIQNSICQKLDYALTGFVTVVAGAYTAVSSTINATKTLIAGMQFSAINVLNNAAAAVDTGLNAAIPDFTDEFADLLVMINSCAFLRTDKTLGNPLTMIRTLKGSLRGNSQTVFDTLTSSLAEFNVAKLMDSLFVSYDDVFDFGKIVPDIYTIIDCIDSLCPNTDITTQVLAFEKYVDKLYLLTDGKFDQIKFFDELGLSAAKVSKIDIALTSYSDMRSRIDVSITDGVNFAKSLL